MCVATYQLPGVAKDNQGAIDLSVVNDRVRLKKRGRVSELRAGGGGERTHLLMKHRLMASRTQRYALSDILGVPSMYLRTGKTPAGRHLASL